MRYCAATILFLEPPFRLTRSPPPHFARISPSLPRRLIAVNISFAFSADRAKMPQSIIPRSLRIISVLLSPLILMLAFPSAFDADIAAEYELRDEVCLISSILLPAST